MKDYLAVAEWISFKLINRRAQPNCIMHIVFKIK